MREYLTGTFTIMIKDLRMEMRTKEILPTMFVFSMIVLVIFNFTMAPTARNIIGVAPGILWVSYSFAAMLGFGRSFASELDHGALKGLLLAPMDRSAIYMGKFFSNTIFILIIEIIGLFGFGILYNIRILPYFPELLTAIIITTVGITSVGTLYSALTTNLRMREILLPLLLFPIMVPVLMGGVRITGAILSDQQCCGEQCTR